MTEESIFAEALEKPSPAERAEFLDRACQGRPALRHNVEGLLAAYPRGQFLEARAPFGEATVSLLTPAEQAGAQIGPYKLLEQIGEGGMGVVYMALQEKPVRRKVALKIIKPGMDTRQVIARFEAERQALALMDHPNIAKILDAGTTGEARNEEQDPSSPTPHFPIPSSLGRPYFVMELVRGIPITDFCSQEGLNYRQRLELFVAVCQAVQHAHQKGVIHRDLKPSNVLVTMQDGRPLAKVIDFGVAKAIGQQLTEKTLFTGFAQLIGTPLYMSPEQAALSAVDVDTRSDVYSLGVLLYELLTGTTPFDKETLARAAYDEIRRMIREDEPPRPSARISTLKANALTTLAGRPSIGTQKLGRQLRGELDWIVMKALDKDRNRRYESPSAFAADVRRYLNDEPVQASPPSSVYRLRKLAKRHKLLVSAATAVFVSLSVGMVSTTFALVEAQKQRDQAEGARIEVGNQRDQAQKNEQRAQEAAEQSRLVLDYFESKLLAACRPAGQDGGLGKDVTLRQAIDAAEKDLAHAFPNRPLVEASIRHSLGQNYVYLGEPELAITQFQRVIEIRKIHRGPEQTATLNAMGYLGRALMDAGKADKALPILEQVLEARKRSLGPHHPETLRDMNELALCHEAHGNLEQTIALLEQILEIRKATLGTDHPKTQLTLNNLGNAYRNAGKTAEAVTILNQNLASYQARLGPDHPDTLIAMHNLALAYEEAHQFDKALPYYQTVLEKRQEILGATHPHTLSTMTNLALAYKEKGDFASAISLAERAMEQGKAGLGADHPDTRFTVGSLIGIYLKAQQPNKALPLLAEFLADEKMRGGSDSERLINVQTSVAVDLLDSGMAREAEPILRKCLDLRTGNNPDAWQTFNTRSLLGGTLLAQQKYAQAEPLLLEGYYGLKEREAALLQKAKSHVTEAGERIVQFYEATHQPEKVNEWREKLTPVLPTH